MNQPEKMNLPGIFIQDEISIFTDHKILLGARYDYNSIHGSIFTPRFAYKWKISDTSLLRLNAGTGFRVVNLFTEDHAALTGARDIVIVSDLKPEKSYNVNLNFLKKFYFNSGSSLGIETTAFYTYFNNKIVPDYTTHTTQIRYNNINGFAVSKGISLNTDISLIDGPKLILGATLMDNTVTQNDVKEQQMLTEKFTAIWNVSYTIQPLHLNIDYIGNLYSPMHLPLLGELDPRRAKSSWWSLQNIQFTYQGIKKWEIYAGVKNILNWTPNRKNPFIIARSHDPFNQNVIFNTNGTPILTAENPYALTFDPSYVYAPNQGIRGFLGVRFKLN